jgi:hypothetical protein
VLPVTVTATVSIATLAAWVEPWHQLVVNSIVMSTALLYLHLAAILVGGGLALAADFAVLNQPTGDGGVRRAASSDDALTHRRVTQGLLVIIGSGFALAAADLVLFWGLPAFWMKMGVFVALLINADAMRRAEHPCHTSRSWTRRRRHAICSVGLWLLTLLGGALLTVG